MFGEGAPARSSSLDQPATSSPSVARTSTGRATSEQQADHKVSRHDPLAEPAGSGRASSRLRQKSTGGYGGNPEHGLTDMGSQNLGAKSRARHELSRKLGLRR